MSVRLKDEILKAIADGKLNSTFDVDDVIDAINTASREAAGRCLRYYCLGSGPATNPTFVRISKGLYTTIGSSNIEHADPTSEQSESWMISLGKFREGMIVSTAGIYACGYLVWAIYFATNRLGFAPLLDAQYFIAGILPFLSGVLLIHYENKLFSPDRPRRSLTVRTMTILLLVLFTIAIVSIMALILSSPMNINLIIATLIIFTVIIGITDYYSELVKRFAWFPRLRQICFSSATLLLLIYYVGTVFPKLPYSFGGPLSKCADISISSSAISKELYSILFNNSDNYKPYEDVTSLQIHGATIHYKGSNHIIISIGSLGNRLLEIPSGSIGGILWCDE